MVNRLLQVVKAIVDISIEEEARLRSILQPAGLKKGELFIREGTIPQKVAFVAAGLFRYYYINEKGSEFTKGFFSEGSFITSYSAMVKNRPSHYAIEALEDSQVLIMDYQQWQVLLNAHPCWTRFLFALVEKGYFKKEARERELLLFSAEERYRSFLEEYPQLENRIKQHQVASYLGITPVALSRIRKGMIAMNK